MVKRPRRDETRYLPVCLVKPRRRIPKKVETDSSGEGAGSIRPTGMIPSHGLDPGVRSGRMVADVVF